MSIKRNKDGFLVFPDGNSTPSIVVESKNLEKYLAYIKKNKFSKIDITGNFGFTKKSLEFLETLNLTQISLWDVSIDDLTPLYSQKKLNHLRFTGVKTKSIIEFDKLPALQYLNASWSSCLNKIEHANNLESLCIWHYKSNRKDFSEFPNFKKLTKLQLYWSNIRSFDGANGLIKLNDLRLEMCTKLEDISQIEVFKGSLEKLYIGNSKKLTTHHLVSNLKKLETLALNDCGNISDLDFLLQLKKLKDFRFVNTNILSGNLSPLLNCKSLKSIGTFDKKHYSHKKKEIESLLRLK